MNHSPHRRKGDHMLNWAAVLTLNNLELTKQTICDLLRQDIGNIWILVIDNGSTDGTREWVTHAAEENQIEYIFNPRNIGVGPSWNLASSYIFGDGNGNTHLLMCNNDIRLRPDTYRHLLTPRGGLITPINVGSVDRMLAGSIDVSFDAWRKGGPDFSCFLLKDWFWQAIGQFPTCYWPAYYEDNETHYIAKLRGYGNAIFSTGVPYYHIGSQTIRAMPELNDYFKANQQLYIQRWGGLPGRETFTSLFGRDYDTDPVTDTAWPTL